MAECAVVPADANGSQVLESVVDVRQADGMTCALDGYPAQGCGEQVKNAEVSADEKPVSFALPASADTEPAAAETDGTAAADQDESGFPWALVAVSLAVLGISVIAIVSAFPA